MALIDNWNRVVTNADDVYVLGDFTYKSAHPPAYYADKLNGRKYLIWGNHDRTTFDVFEEEYHYHELLVGEQLFVLFHYPILSWNKRAKGSIHLYGHVHQAVLPELENRRAYNVGVDTNNFAPISAEAIIEKMKNKPKLKSDVTPP